MTLVIAATSDDDLFQDLSDFFDSDMWTLVRDALVVFVAVLWLAIAYWVFKDARRRIANPWLVALATLWVWARLATEYAGPVQPQRH